MWRAGSSSSQTGPGEPSWDAGSVPGNERVISPPPPITEPHPRVCLSSNSIISPDGCRGPMSACQGTQQCSWWKLPMCSVMMWKRDTADPAVDFSFIWMCQSSSALPPNAQFPLKVWERRQENGPVLCSSCEVFAVMKGLIRMNRAAPEDSLRRRNQSSWKQRTTRNYIFSYIKAET